jgi:methylthioribose-1-phosphate isomerase
VKVGGQPRRTLWPLPGDAAVALVDQRALPHQWLVRQVHSAPAMHEAIADMWLRGAPLIGVAAAYGMALALRSDASDAGLAAAKALLDSARPTAVNLAWATARMQQAMLPLPPAQRAAAAWALAGHMADEDVAVNQALGRHGLALLQATPTRQTGVLNVLTHCNAGWLATVDWGTALAPVYAAHQAGLALHVWVDETRPRNQGASLTAWELREEGVPHTVVADNAGGHLMQRGQVDICLVGADRVTARGDVANKIGTYLKALAAHDNGVPFHVVLPRSSLDLGLHDGLAEIPIEERSPREVTHASGLAADGRLTEVRLTPEGCAAANPGFDVTPARLVTGYITQHGRHRAGDLAALP